jgi:hypothetical protein
MTPAEIGIVMHPAYSCLHHTCGYTVVPTRLHSSSQLAGLKLRMVSRVFFVRSSEDLWRTHNFKPCNSEYSGSPLGPHKDKTHASRCGGSRQLVRQAVLIVLGTTTNPCHYSTSFDGRAQRDHTEYRWTPRTK